MTVYVIYPTLVCVWGGVGACVCVRARARLLSRV